MFKQIALSNFKSIGDEITVDLGSLTVMTGANSSGKSTLLQSLLLLGQTVRYAGKERQLVLNGPLTRLGEFADVRNTQSDITPICIGVKVAPAPAQHTKREATSILPRTQSPTLITARWAFGDRTIGEELGAQDSRTFPTVEQFDLDAEFGPRDRTVPISLHIRRHGWSPERRYRVERYSGETEPLRSSLAWMVELDRFLIPRRDGEAIDIRGAVFDHFLPEALSVRLDGPQVLAAYALNNIVRAPRAQADVDDMDIDRQLWDLLRDTALSPAVSVPDTVEQNPTVGSIRTWIDSLTRVERRRLLTRVGEARERILAQYDNRHVPAYVLTTHPLPEPVARSVQALRAELSGIRYLGPLRVQPAPLYPVATTLGAEDVGPSGEWTASVLDTYKNRVIEYLAPASFAENDRNRRVSSGTLLSAVDEWMEYLGVSREVHTLDRGSLGHELTVSSQTSERGLPLTHVGVGVSQCLPVIVSLLIARPNTITLLEQPELHLHPAVQSRLADFLLAMSLSGRQCLVETHSEYLINRLRLRIAQDAGDEIRDRTRIYFAQIEGRFTHFQELALNEYGAIANWPRGFFDEAQDDVEMILRASSAKRTRRASRAGRS